MWSYRGGQALPRGKLANCEIGRRQLPSRWQYYHLFSSRLGGVKQTDGSVWIKQPWKLLMVEGES